MHPLLEARNLSHSFGGLQAVQDISLSIKPGEVLGIIGPNGAGKTTLFNLLAGMIGSRQGSILLDGKDITRASPEGRAARGLIRSFQHGRPFANLSLQDNLLLGTHTRRRAATAPGPFGLALELCQALFPFGPLAAEESRLRQELPALLAPFGDRLAGHLDQAAYTFSYANRRRIELARALAGRPRLLLLDEPTAGMNPHETLEMLGILKELKARGQTMVVIEHKLPLIMQLCDAVMVMDEGRCIALDLPTRVALDPGVIEAYLGHSHVQAVPGARAAPSSDAAAVPGAPPATTPSAPLLELRHIDTRYGPIQVHFDLSLTVNAGEIVCLLGGNASGKSTAMKIILGLLSPHAGTVAWEGRDITRLATAERIRLGMASVPESRRLFAAMSVDENIRIGAYTRSTSLAIRQDRERVLELFPRLGERLGQKAGTLSGGEQQMLAMARALMGSPRLILMDEPTMGLSPLWVDRVLELIQTLNRQGLAVFMVEQNAHQALAIAQRGYVLQNGHLVMEGRAANLANDPGIRDAYLGSEQMAGI